MSNDSSYAEKRTKTKKRCAKAQSKKDIRRKEETDDKGDDKKKRLVPPGTSLFDLIMPWKTEIEKQETSNLVKNGYSKVVNCSGKNKVFDVNLESHA